ncbi:Uncharacterized protein TCM_021012 [Theobroma cacao]|uniref:Uncharacterized protein n=1 Tax=Theobroma cacao TaxID=3641 RepID=A0A061EMH9_THECC|nr:Uncharacterized protein TCM_021012 [Theobroma cacao]
MFNMCSIRCQSDMASHTRDIKETEVEQRKQAMRQEIMEEAWQQNLVGGYDNAGFVLEPSLSTGLISDLKP